MAIPSNQFGPIPGVYTVAPQTTQTKTLVVDLDCFIAGTRTTRNVLRTRNTAQNTNGNFFQQGFSLAQVASNTPPAQLIIPAPSGNEATIVSADSAVHLILQTTTGTLDLGQNTLFALSSPIVSLTFINDLNIGNVNINCIIV